MREIKLRLEYKGQFLRAKYAPDFICFNAVVVELKALSRMGGTEEAQVILLESHRPRGGLTY